MSKRVLVSMILAAGLLAGVVLAFGLRNAPQADAADPALENAINATVRAAVDAYNRRDFGAFASFWTDKGFMEEMEQTKAEAAANEEFFGDPIALRAVREITATSTGATAVVELEFGLGVEANKFSFIMVGGRWVIDGSAAASAAVPAGATLVDMKLVEFGFVYDKQAVAGGNFAFKAQNTGKQDHEIVILKTSPALTVGSLLEILTSEEEAEGPPPFEDFGFLGILKPGDSLTAALARPLESGKYFLVCFIPDVADGAPHATKGMISEFTVGTATGTGIRPPSTGDGGLVSGEEALLPAVLALVAVVSLAGGLAARRVTSAKKPV